MTQTDHLTVDAFIEHFKQQEKRGKLARYEHLNKMVRKGQILFCGSSLMEQFPVHELLMDLGVDLDLAVYNRGVGGFTTTEMMENLETLVFDLEPAHIFINIGTNDLNGEAYREEDLIKRYEWILTRIGKRLPEASLHILAYYPCAKDRSRMDPKMQEEFRCRTNERVYSANQAVAALAERTGAEFLDFNDAITDEAGYLREEYSVEGVHMYGDGYRKILEQMLPLLQRL